MSRRGFLLAEETLKIIIAVICIGFLIYFLSALYFKNSESEDLEFADATLKRIVDEVGAGAQSVEIYNPQDWVLSSWSEGFRPNDCLNKGYSNCLCLCEKKGLSDWGKDELGKCNELGVCVESKISVKSKEGNFILIDDVPSKLNVRVNLIK